MPWPVYLLLTVWIGCAGLLLAHARQQQGQLPEVYLGNDLVLRFFMGELPHAQQRLLQRYLLVLFVSIILMAIGILAVMVAWVEG